MWRAVLIAIACAALGAAAVAHTVVAQAHPGNTDSNGCHVCRTNCTERWGIPYGFYHRHNPVRPCFEPIPTPTPPGLAAQPLSAAQGCSGLGRVTVTFNWLPSPLAQVQWVDLTLFNNGFVWGTFLGAGPFAPTASVHTWDGLLPNTTHYYRVNTFVNGRWYPSGTYSFITRAC